MPPTTRSSKRSRAEEPTILDQKPPRRARVSEPKVALSALVKHPELWLSDGNIVLAAGDACFKVHRSQLARFCAVFDDMFGAPGLAGVGDEVMEDCVVIRMPDDAADLTHFLEAIYNGHTFNFNTEYADNFSAVAGVLRLATKYDCSSLRTRIVTALRDQYPNIAPPYSFRLFFNSNLTPHANVLLLARECDFLDVLPNCFYQVAFASDGQEESVAMLSPNDKKRLKDGKAAILRRVEMFAENGPPPVSGSCTNTPKPPQNRRTKRQTSNKCAKFLTEYWAKEVKPDKKFSGALIKNPLQGISALAYPNIKYKEDAPGEPPLCPSCNSMISQYMNCEIGAIWDNVKKYFTL